MARSKDFRKYVIVTKKSYFNYYAVSPANSDVFVKEKHEEEYKNGLDKTFWLYEKSGELVGRYSTESAPLWIMEIYNILKNEQENA